MMAVWFAVEKADAATQVATAWVIAGIVVMLLLHSMTRNKKGKR